MIQHCAASTADPAFGDSVLPGAASSHSKRANATCLKELEHLAAEFGVAVEQDVPLATGKRQSVAQLWHDPIARRLRRDMEV